jgi:hypothetical protein
MVVFVPLFLVKKLNIEEIFIILYKAIKITRCLQSMFPEIRKIIFLQIKFLYCSLQIVQD